MQESNRTPTVPVDDTMVSVSDEDDDYGDGSSVNSACSDPLLRSLAMAMDVDPPMGSLFFLGEEAYNTTVADY